MASIELDPNILNEVYKQRLSAAADENIMLSAAVTQLQQLLEQTQRELEAFRAQPSEQSDEATSE